MHMKNYNNARMEEVVRLHNELPGMSPIAVT